ncbi:ketopantoate reductase family protein [Variovorax sp. PBL-E5]|uniref:ketopantoate reductase family protein n=1 Tax=Variovorax sp. PBL-E5 TaxID=434014 RepID=UPI00131624FD|nr:2-dehydropantoate 2-reductase [Variovorax sp. PBL-E5]VTU31458.1 2-dehydropantoate 2-reductase [Variovorax sp. PBL-E5]
MKRITVIGPGAIGGVIASQLQRSGTEVNLLATPRSARAIREHGLRLVDNGTLHVDHPRITDDARALGVQDLVLVCAKGHSLLTAAESFAPLIGPETVIVPALNGIPWWFFEGFGGDLQGRRLRTVDPAGDIERFLPSRQCLGCVVYIASWVDAEGVIRPGARRRLVIGDTAAGAAPDRLERVASLLERAGFDIHRSADIRREVWLKLWGNLTMNPLSALTGAAVDRLVGDPATRQLAARMMEEARILAEGLGIALPMSTEERLAELDVLGPVKTSMLQDLEAGRAPEIDAIVGAVAEIGDLLGIGTPFIDAVLGLVRQLAVTRVPPAA